MPRHTRNILALILVTVWGLQGAMAKAPSGSPEVMMYLHDGTDVTGRITKVTEEAYTLQTAKGSVTVPHKKYQGMVLNTARQKKMSDQITTNPETMIAYGMYSKQTRDKIKADLKIKSKCTAETLKKDLPLVHVEINNKGHINKTTLLNASGCADVDAALLKNIKAIHLEALPKDYPFDMHAINYVYSN